MSENNLTPIQLRGGVDTYHNVASIPPGKFSVLRNLRAMHPGFEQRPGQIRLHTVADASTEIMTLFQMAKGRLTERRLFRQLVDGSVQEATNNPPTTTTGEFGSDVLIAASNAIPGSWAMLDDFLFFSDGIRQHRIYGGNNVPVKGFIVAPDTGDFPVYYKDYTQEVVDDDASTVAVLDALALNCSIIVVTAVPCQSVALTVTTPNSNAVTLSGKFWNGSSFAAMTGFADGTASGGATLAQSGSLTWTAPTTELPFSRFGITGYFYRFSVSGALSATVRVSEAKYNTTWQPLANLWDGVLVDAIEAKVHKDAEDRTYTYGANSISLGNLKTADYVYFSSIDPIDGFTVAPNVPQPKTIAITGTGNINFVDGGAGNDYIECTNDARFVTAGFEAGMSITITGTSSNNVTKTIISVTSSRIYVPTASFTTESNASATITAGSMNVSMDVFQTWTGSAWETMTVNSYLSQGGWEFQEEAYYYIDRTSKTPIKSDQFGTGYEAYWYRFNVNVAKLTSKVNVAVQTMPYFDISQLGKGVCCASWKDRMTYTFDKYSHYVYISAAGRPQVLNGLDFGLQMVGDGRTNKALCMRPFLNELMVWQEEKGELGGCVTLLQGYSPTTFGKLVLSNRVGILNGKCAVVVDGLVFSTATDEKVATLAFWLSREGVAMTDGRYVSFISDDIRNYFDPRKSECIRKGYESKHWLAYDAAFKCLRIGLVSGSSATVPNVFLVYDLVDRSWQVDTLAQPLSCYANIEAASGNLPLLQVAGGASDGFTYQCNTTDDDVSTAVDAELGFEINLNGAKMQLEREIFRLGAQSTGAMSRKLYANGNLTTELKSTTHAQTAEAPNETYRRHSINEKHKGHILSLRYSHNTLSEKFAIYDLGLKVSLLENNS